MIADRIVELRRVPAADLIPNPKNWRKHPRRQRTALQARVWRQAYNSRRTAKAHEYIVTFRVPGSNPAPEEDSE